MIRKDNIRELFESASGGDVGVFARKMSHLMGLSDDKGRPYRSDAGHRELRNPRVNGRESQRLKPSEFSFAHLGRGLMGDDLFEAYFAPDSDRLQGLQGRLRNLQEAGEGAVGPSAFANINAFTGIASGLLEVAILEGWENPDYIGEQLMPDEPSKQFEGRKTIGISRMGDQAEERLPGMPTKRAQIGQRWITQPRTVENALACELLQETVFLDLTGQAVAEANEVGDWLRYRNELRKINAFIGVTNTYTYMDTSYNTYQTASTWDNDFSNELNYYSDIQEAEIKFRDMTDPATSTRVKITPNTMLVNREKLYTARMVLGAQTVVEGSATTSTYTRRDAPNPVNNYKIIESPLVYERCTASDGLNLSATNAGKYWWLFESGNRTIVYVTNWPLRVQQAAPGQLDMIDRGVVLYVKADERGIPMWKEPRRVVRNTN